jgi:hypothetical protein
LPAGTPLDQFTPFSPNLSTFRKNPVFVKSIEAAIEVSQIYAKEK